MPDYGASKKKRKKVGGEQRSAILYCRVKPSTKVKIRKLAAAMSKKSGKKYSEAHALDMLVSAAR